MAQDVQREAEEKEYIDMILENVRAAIALAKKIARFVGRKVCGWESADEEEAEDDDEDGDEEKPPKKKPPPKKKKKPPPKKPKKSG